MELRVLKYFLAVVKAQSISGAAEALHLSQPTLSRQIKEMEEELGKQLLIRGSRKVALTEEGMLLRRRAEEIVALVKKAEDEIAQSEDVLAGDITIGAGETDAVRFIAKAARIIQLEHPMVHFHISSGDKVNVVEELDKGLIDFGLLFGQVDKAKYECLELPAEDKWGVLMRRDSELAEKNSISPEDLRGKPLIISRQALRDAELETWLKRDAEKLDIVATYSLLFNASLMVDEGMGYALCLDKIINVTGESNLCFRPLDTEQGAQISIVWKKNQIFSKASEVFLEKMREMIKR